MGALAKLDISNNYSFISWNGNKSPDFIRPIATMLKTNRTIKELNLAGNNLNAEAARIFSQDIHDNGALASLDISNNDIGQLVLPEGWKSKDDDGCAPWLRIADGHEQDEHPGKPEGVIALANAIQDMGALVSLNLANNGLGVEGAKHLATALPNRYIRLFIPLFLFHI